MKTNGRRPGVPATAVRSRALSPSRLTSVLLAFAATLLLPAVASAAVTIGSGFPAADGPVACTGNDATVDEEDFPCVLIQDTIGGQYVEVPAGGGVITKWTVSGASGTIALRVMRPNGPLQSGEINALTINESPDEEAGAGVQQFETRQSVVSGDYIGAVLQDPDSRIGGRGAPGEQTKLFEGPGELNFDDPFTTSNAADVEIMLRATVEPDADEDGYGDETQDDDGGEAGGGDDFGGGDDETTTAEPPAPDPLAALRSGKAPRATISGKAVKASRKGVIRVKIANPGGYRIKGRLTVKAKRRKLGSAAFSVAAESSKYVSVKLSRKARRALARKRRLGVVAAATFKGPVGKAGTAKKKLTIKAPKPKPKPKPRRPTGGGGGGGGGLLTPGCRMEYVSGGMEYDSLAGTYVFVPGGYKMRCGY